MKTIEARVFSDDKTGETYIAVSHSFNALWFDDIKTIANRFFKIRKDSLTVGRGYLYKDKLYFTRDVNTGEVLFYSGAANAIVVAKKKKARR